MGQRGFSLLELIVLVGIIGLLATIALPQYNNFVSRSRQSEAKYYLAMIYTVENSWRAEFNTYTYCLYPAGYEPPAEAIRFYASGFLVSGSESQAQTTDYRTGNQCDFGHIPWGGAMSSWRNDGVFTMNYMANYSLAGTNPGGVYGVPSPNEFRAVAFGSISSSVNFFDVWSIDQSKVLANVVSGY